MEKATYNLNRPSDVRELVIKASFGVKTLLGLVYLHNDIAAKLGYSIREYKANASGQNISYGTRWISPTHCEQNIQELKARRKSIMKLIRSYCQATNQVADCEMGFRIAQIRGRSMRKPGEKRGTKAEGGLFGLNQKALFIFSDPACEENMRQVIIDSILRSE